MLRTDVVGYWCFQKNAIGFVFRVGQEFLVMFVEKGGKADGGSAALDVLDFWKLLGEVKIDEENLCHHGRKYP